MSCRKTSIFFERKPQLCYPYWPISLWLVNVGNYCKCSEYFHKTSHDDSGIDGFLTPSDSQCGWVMHIDRFTSTECLTQVAFFFFFFFLIIIWSSRTIFISSDLFLSDDNESDDHSSHSWSQQSWCDQSW